MWFACGLVSPFYQSGLTDFTKVGQPISVMSVSKYYMLSLQCQCRTVGSGRCGYFWLNDVVVDIKIFWPIIHSPVLQDGCPFHGLAPTRDSRILYSPPQHIDGVLLLHTSLPFNLKLNIGIKEPCWHRWHEDIRYRWMTLSWHYVARCRYVWILLLKKI